MKVSTAISLAVLLMVLGVCTNRNVAVHAGIPYRICQTGCNTAWVACCALGGGVAGTFTFKLSAVSAAIRGCSKAQGACMSACAALSSPA
ncbi:hypothetical protein BV898_07103 [Hypsibius exemplaris]|uniref:Uncharacterized protein n=1 Tax=Hypsibius exemplaris TaxID=2072580 RepID=A0A1W0WUL9_HYPEX|nr:hypothetical protein BV898_07103 [Hypsibius exemplaris]